MEEAIKNQKIALLNELSLNVLRSLSDRDICGTRPITPQRDKSTGEYTFSIAGPRAGSVTLWGVGGRTSDLLEALSKQRCVNAHNLLPEKWKLATDKVAVYPYRGMVRIEAVWPSNLQIKEIVFPWNRIQSAPYSKAVRSGNFASAPVLLGKDDTGSEVSISFDTISKAHFLVGGMTGGGKSNADRAIAAQVAFQESSRVILIDGKGRRSFGPIDGLPGQIGPLASDLNSIRNALFWAVMQLNERSQSIGEKFVPIYIFFDEPQRFTKNFPDDAIIAMLNLLVSQGRDVNIHVILSTQKPLVPTLGDSSTKEQLGVRIAFMCNSFAASKAILDQNDPRADLALSGSGDSFVLVPGAGIAHRVQFYFMTDEQLALIGGGQPEIQEYPEYDPEFLGETESRVGAPIKPYTILDRAVALKLVENNYDVGRPTLIKKLKKYAGHGMGSERAINLLTETREIVSEMDGIDV